MLGSIFFNERLFLRIGIATVFFAVIALVYTGFYPVIFLPFVWLYLVMVARNWKNAYWLLLLSLPLSTQIFFKGNTLSLGVPDEPIMLIFLVLSFFLPAIKKPVIHTSGFMNPLVIILVLQFLWLILATINSTVPYYSAKFLLSQLWLLSAFFVVPLWIFTTKKDMKTAFVLLLSALVFTMVYTFFNHASRNFSFSRINESIGLWYQNHVEYSTVLSMFFPFVCIAYLWLRKRRSRFTVLMAGLMIFFLVMIYLSYARAAMLAVIFSFLVVWAIRRRIAHFILPCLYAFLVVGVVYVIKTDKYLELRPDFEKTHMYWDFSEHMKATFAGRDESSMERVYRWIAAARMSTEKPLFGYGPHGFYYNYKMYAMGSFKTFASDNEEHSTCHNYFLYMLTEQGYPAMILYALLNLFIFSEAQKIYHRFKDRFYKLCTLGVAMLFAASFVNNFFSELIDTHKVGGLFYLSLAVLVILGAKSREALKDVV